MAGSIAHYQWPCWTISEQRDFVTGTNKHVLSSSGACHDALTAHFYRKTPPNVRHLTQNVSPPLTSLIAKLFFVVFVSIFHVVPKYLYTPQVQTCQCSLVDKLCHRGEVSNSMFAQETQELQQRRQACASVHTGCVWASCAACSATF